MAVEDDWPMTDALGAADGPSQVTGSAFAGRYRLETEIGRGGYGSVWRALELAAERHVALKILRPERLGPEARLRFRREAELARRLSHPNTVRLLDHGQDERGTPFIAYELLEGRTLAALIKAEGALDPLRAAHIAAQALKSLMEAHQHGIVHRDIKPANLFLCDFAGEPDFVKVLDLGIARSTTNAMTALTETGVVIGTPRYMSPEQLRGEPPTPAMDVYAVGLTLAEMLAGRAVYEGTAIDICLDVVSERAVPLPDSVLRSPLANVVRRAVEKQTHLRLPSAAALLSELESPAPPRVSAPSARAAWPPIAWIALGLGALLVVGLAVLGAVLAVAAPTEVVGSTSAPAWIESEAIAARMRDRGWQNVTLKKSEKQIEIVAERHESHASVLRASGKNEAAAQLLASVYAKQGYATALHGKAFVGARVQKIGAGTDAGESRSLLGHLQ